MQTHEFPFKRPVTVCHSCVGVGIGSFMIQTGIKNSTKGHERSLLMIIIKWFVHVTRCTQVTDVLSLRVWSICMIVCIKTLVGLLLSLGSYV